MKVAVVIATYNQEQYIDEAIGSVFNQVLSEGDSVECIVANDASSDLTAQHVEAWAEKYPDHVHHILQPKNVGTVRNTISAFRMICANLDKYDYVAMLDGDDYWCDEYKLQKQLTTICETNSVMAHTNCSKLINGKIHKQVRSRENVPQGDVLAIAVQMPIFVNCTVFFRADCLRKMDFDTIESMDDLVELAHITNILVCSQGNVCFLEDITAVWRRHAQAQTTLNSINKAFRWIEHECVQGRYLNQLFPDVVHFTEKEESAYRTLMQFRTLCAHRDYHRAKELFLIDDSLSTEAIAPYMSNVVLFKYYFIRNKFQTFLQIIRKKICI